MIAIETMHVCGECKYFVPDNDPTRTVEGEQFLDRLYSIADDSSITTDRNRATGDLYEFYKKAVGRGGVSWGHMSCPNRLSFAVFGFSLCHNPREFKEKENTLNI